jgi:hypothetical protein
MRDASSQVGNSHSNGTPRGAVSRPPTSRRSPRAAFRHVESCLRKVERLKDYSRPKIQVDSIHGTSPSPTSPGLPRFPSKPFTIDRADEIRSQLVRLVAERPVEQSPAEALRPAAHQYGERVRRTSGRCGVDPLSGVRIHVPLFECLAADPCSSRSYRMVCMSSCCCSSTQSSLRTWTHSVVTGSGPGRSRLATARAGSPRGQRSVAAGMSVATGRMVAVGPSATVRATVVTGSGPGISRPTGQPLPQDSDIPHRPHRHG